jgi:hypothetical protein
VKLKLLKHRIKKKGAGDGGSSFKLAIGTEKSYVGREHVRDQESAAAPR